VVGSELGANFRHAFGVSPAPRPDGLAWSSGLSDSGQLRADTINAPPHLS
jgi:hypothetical protein